MSERAHHKYCPFNEGRMSCDCGVGLSSDDPEHARLLAIESAARAFEADLDAQDVPEGKRMLLLALRVALAEEG